MINTYSILVNTCDKFEDCWNPFFLLFSKYWPNCNGKIYLNTEYKDYMYEGLDIYPIKCCEGKIIEGKFATWSQCLKWALESIDSDIILYLQEDYFLKNYVVNNKIEEYVQLMLSHKGISCIHLTDQGVEPELPSQYPSLYTVKLKQKYRVSCQAALWRKDELLKIIRTYESAWEFEEFGSQRSNLIGSEYYVVDKKWVKKDIFEIIPYIFTGIVKGQWIPEAKELFEKNGIEIDYSIRGFYSIPCIYRRIINRFKKIPSMIRNRKALRQLKHQLRYRQ